MQAVKDMATMDTYVDGVMGRANHHAKHVNALIPALRGYVETYGKEVHALTRNGLMKNISWFRSKVTGDWFYFRHEYGIGIELRRNNNHGPIVAVFTNKTTLDELFTVFSVL